MGCNSSKDQVKELDSVRSENERLKALVAEKELKMAQQHNEVKSLHDEVEEIRQSVSPGPSIKAAPASPDVSTKSPTVGSSVAEESAGKENGFRVADTVPSGVTEWPVKDIPTFADADTVEKSIFALNTATSQSAMEKTSQTIATTSKIVSNALETVIRLATENVDNQRRFGELGACDHVVSMMMVYAGSSKNVCEKALRAIKVLCRCSADKSTSNKNNLMIFLDNGGCEAVVAAIEAHTKVSEIVDLAAQTVAVMAFDPRLNFRLGVAGACEALLNALKEHAQEPDLVEQIMKTMFNLTAFDANRDKLGGLGLCEISIHTLNHYATVSSITMRTLAVISSLASDDEHKLRFNNPQSSAAIVKTITNFSTVEDIVEYACLAIASLCSSHVDTAALFGKFNACEEVMNVLMKNTDKAGVVEQACMAIMNLSIDDGNNNKLGKIGACEYVLLGFDPLFKSNTKAAEQAVMAIINLAVDTENRDKLGDHGACSAVVKFMDLVEEDPAATKECCMAINNLAANNPVNKTLLGESGACMAVSKVLEKYIESGNIVNQALGAITNLASIPENREIFGDSTTVCKSVVAALQSHVNSRMAVEKACNAIENLALDDEDNRQALKALGAISLLEEVQLKYVHEQNGANVLRNAQVALETLSFKPEVCSPRRSGKVSSMGSHIQNTALSPFKEANTPPKPRGLGGQQSVHHFASMKSVE